MIVREAVGGVQEGMYENSLYFVLHFAVTLCRAQSLSQVQLFVTPWTTAHQAPLSTGFSRHENWSG